MNRRLWLLSLIGLLAATADGLPVSSGEWHYLLVDLTSTGEVTVSASGVAHCPGAEECALSMIHYSSGRPTGEFGRVVSGVGWHLRGESQGIDVEASLFDAEDPWPVSIEAEHTFTAADDGAWGVFAVLTSGTGSIKLEADPPRAIQRTGSYSGGVHILHPWDFQNALHASGNLGAAGFGTGASYVFEAQPRLGMLGWFAPLGLIGEVSYEGPDGSYSCLDLKITAMGSECSGRVLHTIGGPSIFSVRMQAAERERPWGMWVDALPPELPADT